MNPVQQLTITLEILRLIAEIYELKGRWQDQPPSVTAASTVTLNFSRVSRTFHSTTDRSSLGKSSSFLAMNNRSAA